MQTPCGTSVALAASYILSYARNVMSYADMSRSQYRFDIVGVSGGNVLVVPVPYQQNLQTVQPERGGVTAAGVAGDTQQQRGSLQGTTSVSAAPLSADGSATSSHADAGLQFGSKSIPLAAATESASVAAWYCLQYLVLSRCY